MLDRIPGKVPDLMCIICTGALLSVNKNDDEKDADDNVNGLVDSSLTSVAQCAQEQQHTVPWRIWRRCNEDVSSQRLAAVSRVQFELALVSMIVQYQVFVVVDLDKRKKTKTNDKKCSVVVMFFVNNKTLT